MLPVGGTEVKRYMCVCEDQECYSVTYSQRRQWSNIIIIHVLAPQYIQDGGERVRVLDCFHDVAHLVSNGGALVLIAQVN